MKNNSVLKSIPYSITKILGYIVSMLALPILTNLFDKTQFGMISTLEAKITLIVSIFLFGIPQSYIRFYNRYSRSNQIDVLNSSFLFLIGIVFILASTISYIVLSFGNVNNVSVIILAFLVGNLVIMQQISSIIRAKEKTLLHSLILGLNDILSYALPIAILYMFGISINNYFLSKLIVPLSIFLLILLVVKKELKFVGVKGTIIKEMLVFGIPLVLVSIGGTIFSSGDRIIINHIMGSEQVAVYSVASKIAHAIQQLMIFPINMVLFPMYIRIWEEEGRKRTEQILSKWFIVYVFIATAIIAGSISIRKEAMVLLSNSSYIDGAIIIPILTAGLLIYGGYYFISAGFFVSNRTFNLGIIIFSTSLLNVALNYIMGKYMGLIGVALATAIAYVVFMIITYIIGNKILTIKFYWTQIIKFIISAIIMILVLSMLSGSKSILIDLLVKISVGFIVYVVLNIRFVIKQLRG
ncbi:oligosaccharide flippase family protein [Senegalia massiliensis]|uniref:oligosaccharide flippase family protein n=1 Tax=Senegalia massiliensis TaxID=1720316 RepID=UPI001031C7BB|nr:oligosaccharide flippase family protein [Senegalia massiliensis]